MGTSNTYLAGGRRNYLVRTEVLVYPITRRRNAFHGVAPSARAVGRGVSARCCAALVSSTAQGCETWWIEDRQGVELDYRPWYGTRRSV